MFLGIKSFATEGVHDKVHDKDQKSKENKKSSKSKSMICEQIQIPKIIYAQVKRYVAPKNVLVLHQDLDQVLVQDMFFSEKTWNWV